ncbi:MAG: non-ribosomal peptide synthetase, partial [Nitrospira sp.]|nr:non-ribosomal peptide synthetase [Nitrospira sp.]
SLLAVQLVARLQDALQVEVPLRELFTHPTLSTFADALYNQAETVGHPNLVPIRPNGTLQPLFFIHPSAGEVGYVRSLTKWLDIKLPIYALAARGLLKGETPLRTIEAMAALYIQAIRHVQPQGPYRVAGYSFGGTVAYEIANQLIGADETVEFLGLIDTGTDYSPLPGDEAVADAKSLGETDTDECSSLIRALPYNTPEAVLDKLKILAACKDFDAMLAHCQAADLIPREVDTSMVRRHLAVIDAAMQAGLAYTPSPISAPITLFRASENEHTDNTLGWGALAGEHLHIISIGGDHFTLMKLPHIKTLGEALSEVLIDINERTVAHPEHSYHPRLTIQGGSSTRRPLFCVPGAGASITTFQHLARALDLNTPIHGMQPRGLDGMLVPHIDVPTAARAYIQAIREVSPRGPYQLLGHSFGGWVAFEMARQLLALGEPIAALIIIDSEAPWPPSQPKSRYSRVAMLLKLVSHFELHVDRSLRLAAADFALLDHDQQLNLLLGRLIEVNCLPRQTKLQTLRGIVRVFETNLNTSYTPESIYSGPLLLVGPADAPSKAGAAAHTQVDLVTPWRQYAPEAIFWEGSGNHITLLSLPAVAALADQVRHLLQGDE